MVTARKIKTVLLVLLGSQAISGAKTNCTNDLYSAARTGCPAECSGHGLCWSTFDAATLEWSPEPVCHCEDWYGGEACAFRDLTTLELAPVRVDVIPPANEVELGVLFEEEGIEITANGTDILPEQMQTKPTITVPELPPDKNLSLIHI